MKKYLSLVFFTFLGINMFCQMTQVPGQPTQSYILNSIKVNENVAFFTYAGQRDQVYVLDGNQLSEIIWTDTPLNFNPHYKGHLGDKYYFFNIFGSDGLLYEYDHDSKNTRKIPFPAAYPCYNLLLLSDEFQGKIHYACGMSGNGDTAIIEFDGNNFQVYPTPADQFIMREDFLYADQLDEILIWYAQLDSNTGAKLYTFDGNSLTHIPNPDPDFLPFQYGIPFDDHVILPYVEVSDGIDMISHFYKYDGSNLVEIPGMPSTIFHRLDVFEGGQGILYFALANFTTETSSLYKYDGINFTEIFTSSYYAPLLISSFGGKDLFSLHNKALNYTSLYAFDGNTLDEIPGAQSHVQIGFSGILNNKLYLRYSNSITSENDLYSYSIGDTQVQLVPSTPSGVSYLAYQIKHNNTLLHKFKVVDFEHKIFAQDQNDQFWDLDPQNYVFFKFDFQMGNKVFFTYRTPDDTSYKVFMWEGVLDTPDYSTVLNNIVIFPNPTSNTVIVEIPNELTSQNLEISIFSIDGKMVYQQSVKNTSSQLEVSLSELKRGIYILELKGEDRVIRNKIVRK